MTERLEGLRQMKFVGVTELAQTAARVLAERGPMQARGTVSELPDERTVRYYLAEGLLAPAEEKQGTASVFGYLHLLQLLVVKNLQAQHLSIRKIRELVEGRSERELTRLLGGTAKTADKNAALSYLETLLTQPRSALAPPMTASLSAGAPPHKATAPTAPTAPASNQATDTWARVELAPGLELHIHSAYQPPTATHGIRKLGATVLRAVELYGQHLMGKRGK